MTRRSWPARAARAAGALIVLLAVIIGVPVLLSALGMVPHSLPGAHGITRTLTAKDHGQLAGTVIGAAAWVCWALFTASAVRELAAAVRHRPANPMPGLRVFQRPVAALVAALVVGFTAAPLAVGGAAMTAAHAAPLPVAVVHAVATPGVSPAAAQPAAEPAGAPAKTYTVRPRDTLWAIAQRHLGDPLRFHELAQLNAHLVGPDNQIKTGSVLRLPADATGLSATEPEHATAAAAHTSSGVQVQVQPGDSLWSIERRVTGDGANWPQAWEANRGRAEPGGRHFEDPDLLRPGYTLTIPDPANDGPLVGSGTPHPVPAHAYPGADPPAPTQPAPAATAPSPVRDPVAGAATAHSTAAPTGGPTAGAPRTPATAATVPAPPSRSAAGPVPVAPPRSVAAGGHRAESQEEFDAPMVAFTGGGMLLAGVSLTALMRYRRRQFRLREPGRTVGRTPPSLLRVERALLAAGPVGSVNVNWLDQALRSLVQSLATVDGARLPDVVAVRMTDDVLELVLTVPAPGAVPEPWVAEQGATRWTVRRADELPYDPAQRGFYVAPFPTLVSVGYTAAGEQWMLDLERIAALSLAGDAERCLSLARYLATELAHNTWSEMLQVTLVGFGAELIEVNPDRLSYTDDLDKAITELDRQFTSVIEVMGAAGVDVLSGRLRDVVGDMWAPQVLLIAPQLGADSAGMRRLLAAMKARPGRAAVALVLADDPDHADATRWQMSVDEHGVLRIPALDLELIAQQNPAHEAADLARMLAANATTVDHQPAPAPGDKAWEAYADVCGGLRPDALIKAAETAAASGGQDPSTAPVGGASGAVARPVLHLAQSAPWPTDSVLPLSPQRYLERTATTECDLKALAPVVNDGVRVLVESADPELDGDLADWYDPQCSRPKITLLGAVKVEAQGELPAGRPRQAFRTEIVAYLATRPGGVTVDRYAAAIWPDDPAAPGSARASKVRKEMSVVRHWLGYSARLDSMHVPSGVVPGQPARYRLDDVLVDAELFRRLRVRGLARGAAGIADLRRALDLVTGKPFDRLREDQKTRTEGYRWLADENSRLDLEYPAMIVDVAHTVATHHLCAGEPVLAASAAQVALAAGSYEDVPLLDLVRACDAQDNPAGAEVYVKRILSNHDVDIEEDLPPRTAEVLLRRQHWSGTAS